MLKYLWVIKMNFIQKMKNDKEYRKHIITYLVFGVITTLVSWGSFWAIRKYIPILNENIANIISIVLAVVVAYITNRKYVFLSNEKNIIKEFIAFCSGRLVTMMFETIAFWIFATVLGINEMLVKVGVSVIVVILNYIISKIFVFKNRKEM